MRFGATGEQHEALEDGIVTSVMTLRTADDEQLSRHPTSTPPSSCGSPERRAGIRPNSGTEIYKAAPTRSPAQRGRRDRTGFDPAGTRHGQQTTQRAASER
ncbi:hypothetical protein GCM10010399_88210 [Dactylosporangium fulvum]